MIDAIRCRTPWPRWVTASVGSFDDYFVITSTQRQVCAACSIDRRAHR